MGCCFELFEAGLDHAEPRRGGYFLRAWLRVSTRDCGLAGDKLRSKYSGLGDEDAPGLMATHPQKSYNLRAYFFLSFFWGEGILRDFFF